MREDVERTRLDRNRRAWTEVLDRLEGDVEALEASLHSGAVSAPPTPSPWQPPELDGPLPDDLLDRARDIHQRQTSARTALAEALVEARARQELARRPVRPSRTLAAAAYVDVSA